MASSLGFVSALILYLASNEIIRSLQDGGECLDCGANTGGWFNNLSNEIALTKKQYYGIEWNQDCVLSAQKKDINITQGNLNQNLPYIDNTFGNHTVSPVIYCIRQIFGTKI